jgi:hypothetical protein
MCGSVHRCTWACLGRVACEGMLSSSLRIPPPPLPMLGAVRWVWQAPPPKKAHTT